MRTVSHQGMSLSSSERRSLAMRQQVRAATASTLLQDIDRQFQATDWESVRYWDTVANFKRYGFAETNRRGTPFVGDAFGF